MPTLTPKQEVEDLVNDLLPLAKTLLSNEGEFFPYGGYIGSNGKIAHVGAELEGVDKPKSEALIKLLRDALCEMAARGKCKATAIIFDVRIIPPDSHEKSDAIQICLDHREGYSAEVFVPYRIERDAINYGPAFTQRGDCRIFMDQGIK